MQPSPISKQETISIVGLMVERRKAWVHTDFGLHQEWKQDLCWEGGATTTPGNQEEMSSLRVEHVGALVSCLSSIPYKNKWEVLAQTSVLL